MLPLSNIKLCELISQKQKSSSHLKKPNFTQFIKVCQSHQQIITTFSQSKHCKKTCLVCPQCQKHRNEQLKTYQKHTQLSLSTFSSILKQIKQKYQQYHKIYTTEIIPIFLNNIKVVILQFLRGVEKWNQDTVLLQNFIGFCRNRKIFQVLTQEIQDWDLGEFSCGDLWELGMVRERVCGRTAQDMRESISDDLRSLFSRSLSLYGLIPKPQSKRQKQQLLIQANLQQLTTRLKTLQQSKPQKPEQTLTIELTQPRPHPTLSNPPISTPTPTLTPTQTPSQQKILTETQQQHNQKLGEMIESLFKYLQGCGHRTVKLLFSVEEGNVEFWEYLVGKLVELGEGIVQGRGRIQQIYVGAKHYAQLYDMIQKQAQNTTPKQSQVPPDKALQFRIKSTSINFCSQKHLKPPTQN